MFGHNSQKKTIGDTCSSCFTGHPRVKPTAELTCMQQLLTSAVVLQSGCHYDLSLNRERIRALKRTQNTDDKQEKSPAALHHLTEGCRTLYTSLPMPAPNTVYITILTLRVWLSTVCFHHVTCYFDLGRCCRQQLAQVSAAVVDGHPTMVHSLNVDALLIHLCCDP